MTNLLQSDAAWEMRRWHSPPRGLPPALSWLPPLWDVYLPQTIWEWHYIGISGGECVLRKSRPRRVLGEQGDVMWGHEVEWESIIMGSYVLKRDWRALYDDRWLLWALEHGVAPGQHFCLATHEPTFHEYISYEGEYDCDLTWIWAIVAREPVDASQRWPRCYDRIMGKRARGVAALREYEKQRIARVDMWAIQRDRLYTRDVGLQLVTRLPQPAGLPRPLTEVLLSARGKTERAALDELALRAAKDGRFTGDALDALYEKTTEYLAAMETVTMLQGVQLGDALGGHRG